MANPHPREQSIYETIEREKIKVPFFIWDLIYHYIGDEITAITHIVAFFHQNKEAIDIPSAKKIITHTQNIRALMDKILHPEKIPDRETLDSLQKIKKEDVHLHPLINELFTHYISNDIYGINMIVCFYLDPLDENPVPVEDAEKILGKIATMKQFMDQLSQRTNQAINLTLRQQQAERASPEEKGKP